MACDQGSTYEESERRRLHVEELANEMIDEAAAELKKGRGREWWRGLADRITRREEYIAKLEQQVHRNVPITIEVDPQMAEVLTRALRESRKSPA